MTRNLRDYQKYGIVMMPYFFALNEEILYIFDLAIIFIYDIIYFIMV